MVGHDDEFVDGGVGKMVWNFDPKITGDFS
jgi:hypothetical protein